MSATWVTEPNAVLVPKLDKDGFGAVPPKTVVQTFINTVTNHGAERAMCLKRPVDVSWCRLVHWISLCFDPIFFNLINSGSLTRKLENLDLETILG